VGRTTKQKLNSILNELEIVPNRQEEVTTYILENVLDAEREEEINPGLTVSLASDSPIDAELIVGQSLASIAKFTFVNGDDKEIKITQLKFKRIGASSNTTLASIYLFEGTKRLTTGTSILSTGVVSFTDTTGIIVIPPGDSKTIMVKSDIASNTNNQIVGVSIDVAGDIITDASSVNALFPISSNLMTIRSVTLAEADFNSTTTPAANTSVTPQNNYTVWQNTVSIPTRTINLSRFSLRESGTADYSVLQNFQLYINGTPVGSVVESLDEDGFVVFDLSNSPQRLEIGYSTIKVSANIIGGSSKTFKFSMETTADADFVDTEYGINVLPTANSSTFTARTSGIQTISTESVTITKKVGGPVDVVNSISAETIAEFIMTAAGERVKIESLEIEVLWHDDDNNDTGLVGSLRNGMILVNGVQMGSAADIDVDEDSSHSTGTTYSFSSSLILEPGEPVILTIKADIYDNNGTNNLENDDTLQVNILAGSSNAEGLVSKSAISVPSIAVTGQVVEVEQGALNLGKYIAFPDKTYVVPITATKIAHFTLMSSKEDVNLNTISVNLATVAGAVDASDDLSNLYVVYGSNITNIKPVVVDGDNSWPISYELEKHTVLEIMVYADIGLSAYAAGTNTIIPKLTVSGTSVESGASAASSQTTGQTITFDIGEEGDLTGQVAGDSPLDRIVAGNSTVTGAKFKFIAVNDNFLLKTIKMTLDQDSDGDAAGAILYAILKEEGIVVLDKNGNEVKREPGAGDDADRIEFGGLDLAILANTSRTFTFDLVLDIPNSDISPPTSQANLRLELEKIKYENSLGDEISDSKPGPNDNDPDANHLYVYKSIPVFTHIDLGNSNEIFNGMSTKLYSFKVKADSAGAVALKQLKFGLNWNNANSGSLSLDTFRIKRDLQDITSIVTIQDTLGNSLESITDTVTSSHSVVIFTFDTEEIIPAGQEKIYDVYARPAGFQGPTSTTSTDTVVINLKGGSDESAHNGDDRYLFGTSNTAIMQLAEDAVGTNASDYNVIWSDDSATLHKYKFDDASNDWANSYLVLDLPLDGEAWKGQ